jgi:hypothetical protein
VSFSAVGPEFFDVLGDVELSSSRCSSQYGTIVTNIRDKVEIRLKGDTAARILAVLCVSMSAAACSVVVKDPFAALAGSPVASGDVISRQEALDDLDFLVGTLDSSPTASSSRTSPT